MSLDLSSDETEGGIYQDELADFHPFEQQQQEEQQSPPKENSRQVRLILDHTAFVRGIGNVKRWFNEDYVNQNLRKSDEVVVLNLYIPSYTLHEFEFVKKGTSISATNAREAIRFIDKYVETENDSFERIKYNLLLETPEDAAPQWGECLKFKVHKPRVKEFPNYKTKLDSNVLGQGGIQNDDNDAEDSFSQQFGSSLSISQRNKVNDIQYENSPSYQNALENSNKHAEMPVRLRYLIRTCIYKRFIEKHAPFRNELEEWKLVTEDPIAKIWAKSFGIDCLNVNEAELLLFQNYDVNSYHLYNPHNNFLNEEEYDPSTNILQHTIDTTLYTYRDARQEPPTVKTRGRDSRRGGRGRRRNNNWARLPTEYVVQESRQERDGSSVKKEKFGAINYAPRPSGELWEP
ncbi:NMD4 [[Candida] subhashii]|uniref:NMD4 n=1 Tax=[Candida] subhashii TaxID=561895 RepID=A0A8J5R5I8_9ASCO|nr:NMD4 [[Candida] subhashii]KAG7665530.1 NMD4 [[Candida] subhashii]